MECPFFPLRMSVGLAEWQWGTALLSRRMQCCRLDCAWTRLSFHRLCRPQLTHSKCRKTRVLNTANYRSIIWCFLLPQLCTGVMRHLIQKSPSELGNISMAHIATHLNKIILAMTGVMGVLHPLPSFLLLGFWFLPTSLRCNILVLRLREGEVSK